MSRLKIAISGFGRIGKGFFRAALKSGELGKTFDIVAINSRSGPELHAHLLKYDSVFGKLSEEIEVDNQNNLFKVGKYEIKWINETDPLKLPWKEMGVDIVVESSGKFRSREDAEKHIKAGAKRVIISAPGKEVDGTIVMGVNDDEFEDSMQVISLASCTTNCLAPVLHILDKKFGIESGFLSTIHAYTSDQRLLDGSHKDFRRARAAAVNIVPTTTGAAKAIGKVIKKLDGKLDGVAFRVPVPDGSINDMILLMKKETTAEEVNSEIKRASESEMKGILAYTNEPVVSSDIIGRKESSIVDGQLTKAIGRMVKISSWYDNEFGYSNRIVDFIKKLSRKEGNN